MLRAHFNRDMETGMGMGMSPRLLYVCMCALRARIYTPVCMRVPVCVHVCAYMHA